MDKFNCRLCGFKTKQIFTRKVLNKYDVKYLWCPNCSLIQTENPYWLSEAYSTAISDADTGILSRNLDLMKKLSIILLYLFGDNAKKYTYLDYGGGYGLLVRLMRDIGFDFYWYDKYSKNIFSKGFEFKNQPIKAVAAFEVFEHLLIPKELIDFVFKELRADSIIFSTFLYGEKPPRPVDWWYYNFQTGQHISFYNLKTLKYLARKNSMNLLTDGISTHIITKHKKSELCFKILLKISRFLFPFVRRSFKSKTFEDYETISK